MATALMASEIISATPRVHSRIHKKVVNADSIEAMTEATDKMVTGTFIHIEYPGQSKHIACRYYKNQEYFSQNMMDGETYTVPLSVARHINERCVQQTHGSMMDAKGDYIKNVKTVSKCKFIIGG